MDEKKKKYPECSSFIKNRYKIGISNIFMLTGNIGDYVTGTTSPLKDYLEKTFLRDKYEKEGLMMEEVYTYDINKGGQSIYSNDMPKGSNFETFVNKIANIQTVSDQTKKIAFIITYPQYIIPEDDRSVQTAEKIVALHSALSSVNFLNSNRLVIFIADTTSGINSQFLGSNLKMSMFNIELPTVEQRLDFIENWTLKNNGKDQILWEITEQQVANLTAGLQLTAIEDILLLAKSRAYIDNDMILRRKTEVIKTEFGEVIELFETDGYSLDKFAGQEHIKNYFREVVIDAVKNDELDIVPKGVMLMGPPGTGKTYFSRCLAGEAGINFVEFKMSKILGKYVGESEKSMEKALSVFRALAPVGVFMDEIDQSFKRGNGGDGASNVNSNIFGMLLSEMSKETNRGKIIWLAATNYPNNVDEALKRAGRFDKKIPFFAPTEEERIFVFRLHLKKNGFNPDKINIDELVKGTDGYTQAEIESIVVKALELYRRAKGNSEECMQEKLKLAMSYMLSAQNTKIKEMEDIALSECNDQEFIPEKYKERQKELLNDNEQVEVNRANIGR